MSTQMHWWGCKWCSCFGKHFSNSSVKFNTVTIQPIHFISRHKPKGMKIYAHAKMCTQTVINSIYNNPKVKTTHMATMNG